MSLFDASPLAHDAASRQASARRSDASRDAGRFRRAGAHPRAGQAAADQIERDQLTSIILWGPPGRGEDYARPIIARMTKSEFLPFSAVLAGIKEIKAVMADAERLREAGPPDDPVHRRNSSLQ